MSKRTKTPIGFAPKEKRTLQQAARLDRTPWTTWTREQAMRAAGRRIQKARRRAAR